MSLKNKVTIIGAGFVGSTSAYSLITNNVAEEIALIDINQELVKSQVMDLQHSVPFWGFTKVKVGTYQDIKDSKIVVITCGASQKEGDTRLDLVAKNSVIIKDIVPKVFKQNPKAILVMVTNPVDILTNIAVKLFPTKRNQIFGSGTILDSARLRFLIGEKLDVNPSSVHAYIVGEHGDSEVALWSTATVGNVPVENLKELAGGVKKSIFDQAKNAAYAIIKGKQSTYYAIGAGVAQICHAVLHNTKAVMPVSHYINGEYGIKDVCLSLPAIIGSQGITGTLNPKLSALEQKQLKASAQTLKKVISQL
jgi:L-lactate dehydrogenase